MPRASPPKSASWCSQELRSTLQPAARGLRISRATRPLLFSGNWSNSAADAFSGGTPCNSGLRTCPIERQFANCCNHRPPPVRAHFGGWSSASAIGMRGPSTCPAPITCKPSNTCSRTTASLPVASWRLAARSTSPICAAPCFCLLHATTRSLRRNRYLRLRVWSNSRRCAIQKMIAPGSHLALFMGKDTLRDAWSEIAQWVSS